MITLNYTNSVLGKIYKPPYKGRLCFYAYCGETKQSKSMKDRRATFHHARDYRTYLI